MTATEVEDALAGGAIAIDARAERHFDRAHIRGSFYAGSRSDFVAWVGWRAPYDRPVVLVLERDEDYETYRTELRRIGIDAMAGYLTDGIDAWLDSGGAIDQLQVLSPERFLQLLQSSDDAMLLDVRSRDEWKTGHIEHARNAFAGDISAGSSLDVDDDGLVMLACASGYRSRVAASILQSRGVERIVQLDGGMDAWDAAGLPVERDKGAQ